MDRGPEPFDGEGFSQVVVLRDPAEVDQVTVVRQVRASAG